MQLDWHDLKTNGCPALLRALKQIETTLNQQEQDITEVMDILKENMELQAKIIVKMQQWEIVEVLENGWRIVRQPAAPNASAATSAPSAATTTAGVPADSWLPGPDWVTDYAAATDAK